MPPGGAAILEFKASVPGQFGMMDHAMARMAKGLMATFTISGAENAALMHAGPAADSIALGLPRVSGMTQTDTAASVVEANARVAADNVVTEQTGANDTSSDMRMEDMMPHTGNPMRTCTEASHGAILPQVPRSGRVPTFRHSCCNIAFTQTSGFGLVVLSSHGPAAHPWL